MAKEIDRSKEQKEYRNKLTLTLKNLRSLGRNDLAKNLLEGEKIKDIYKDSERKRVEVQKEIRTLNKEEIQEVLDKIQEIKNRWKEETPKPRGYIEQPKPTNNETEELKPQLKCPICGAEDHVPDAKFCHICGASFDGKERNDQEKEETITLQLRCPNCGETDHEPGAKFCQSCGASFDNNEEEE